MKARRILAIIALLLGAILVALAIFAATFDANRYKPEVVELVRQQTGRTLAIDGELSLSVWPRISLAMGKAALSGANGKGEAARFESGRLAVAIWPLLDRRLVIEGVALEGLGAMLGDDPASAWRIDAAALRTDRIASGEPGQLALEGRLRSADGATDLELKLESGYLADFDARTLQLRKLDAQLDGAAAGLSQLRARLGADVAVDLAGQRIDASTLSIDASVPDGPRLKLSGTGRVELQPGSAVIALQGTLDDTQLMIDARAPKLAPLALNYDVAADRLDVDRLRERLAPAMKPAPQASAAPAGQPSAPEAPGPQPPATATAPGARPQAAPAIAAIETLGTLKIYLLLVSGLTLSKLAATATTGNDRIAIEPLTGQLNGGALQARLSTTAAGHRLAASLTGADAGALIRDAARRDVLDGQGTVRVDLAASGDTADALTRSLAGTASLALRDGAIKGFDLDRLMQQVRAALDGRLPVEERVKGAEQTPFSSLTASFRIAAGVARSDDLDFRANWVRAAGAGQIDLGAQSLDWLVRATVTEPTGATQDGAARRDVFARLQGLPVPIRIFGRYDDLRYRVDVKELATEAAKRELTRRLEKSIGERLGLPPSGTEDGAADPLERLKGLLRR